MVLQNNERSDLTPDQIAAHLGVRTWSVTRELHLWAQGQAHRLPGRKIRGIGVGRGGQWRINREDYLNWLGIPPEDRKHLDADGLPQLLTFESAAISLTIDPVILRTLVRQQRLQHITFGRRRYLTHNQLAGIVVLLNDDLSVHKPAPHRPDPQLPDQHPVDCPGAVT